MQRAPASGGEAGVATPSGPTLTQALEQTRTVVGGNRHWYEALVLRGQVAEASAGEQITLRVAEGFSLAVNAVNVDLLKPVCIGLQELFAAIKGATAAREELIGLLSYCVLITSIILNQALLADLPKHITDALHQVEVKIRDINNSAQLFDRKTGCCLPCRRLRRHARDREEIQEHKAELKQILELATQAAGLDNAATGRKVLAAVTSLAQGPPAPIMAKVPPPARSLPPSYVARPSMLEAVVAAITMAADGTGAPHVLCGMGGSGKTTLAKALVSDHRIRKHFRRGVFWINVGQDPDLVDLLQTLARGMVVDLAGPIEFSNEEEGIHRLTAWVAEDPSPRLVVLDDVSAADVVNSLRRTGLKLLVTTRVRALVATGEGYTEVGNMTEAEASALLKKQSGAVHLPEAEANKVAEDCGWLALALAIAGALPNIRRSPDDSEAWRGLHVEITNKKRAEDDLRMPPGTSQDKSKLALFPVLGLSIDQLYEDTRDRFFNLVVLARGIPAPVDMLTNLWEQKNDLGAREKADFLSGRSLLQEVQGGHYQLHDLMLDFIRMKCGFKYREVLVTEAVERQRSYLGRLVVLQRYSDVGEHLHTGVYALASIWRSLEELSGTDRLAETYNASLDMLGRTETADVAHAYHAVANFFCLTGKLAEAESLYKRSLAIDERVYGPDHPKVAKDLNNWAGLLESQGEYEQAEPLYERAIVIWEAALGSEHPQVAAGLNNLAELLRAQGKYDEADPLYVRVLEILGATVGEEHPNYASTLNNRAELLRAQGKLAEAVPLNERATEIWMKAWGAEHPTVATALNNRAGLLCAQGKYDEAEPLYKRTQEIFENSLGRDHPNVATILNNRAVLLEAQGKYEEAEPLYKRSLAIDEKVYGPDHPEVATDLNNWAQLLESQGKYEEAGPLYERSLAIHERVYGPDHPAVATALNNRAVLLSAQGNHMEAISLMERALSIRMTKLGESHPDTVRSQNSLEIVRKKV